MMSKPNICALTCWELFIYDEIINLITCKTNKKIESKIAQLTPELIAEKYITHCKLTTTTEVRAFIGLIYMRGLLNMNHMGRKYLFRDDIGPAIFGATMSSKRFDFLFSNISFDAAETRISRWDHDRFAAIRELFELFNNRCSIVVNPQDYIALDETLYACRTRVNFKQYNSSKPAKYGILFKSINCARTPYTFRVVVYAGKPVGEPSQYYVPGIIPTVKSLFTGWTQHTDIKGRNVTMDRLYISV